MQLDNRVRFLARGEWDERHVSVIPTASTRSVVPDVERAIDAAWIETNARPGVTLFDGPICRLESFDANPSRLELRVSTSSYRINVGTHFVNPHFADLYGSNVMANPIGVSAGLVSSDGYLLMGRRNGRVAYYPHRLHPFAGSLEVRDQINLFDDVRRELNEELQLSADDITSIKCIGIVEDRRLRHPETIFRVRTRLSLSQLQSQVRNEEHDSSDFTSTSSDALRRFAERDDLTPVGSAVAVRLAELIDTESKE